MDEWISIREFCNYNNFTTLLGWKHIIKYNQYPALVKACVKKVKNKYYINEVEFKKFIENSLVNDGFEREAARSWMARGYKGKRRTEEEGYSFETLKKIESR